MFFYRFNDDECDEMFCLVNVDDEGNFNYLEFVKMIKYGVKDDQFRILGFLFLVMMILEYVFGCKEIYGFLNDCYIIIFINVIFLVYLIVGKRDEGCMEF